MKINSALILCAGYGKRLNPVTLEIPKPLLKLNNITMLENCINLIIKLGIKKICLNTFHLKEQIIDFVNTKNFEADIQIVEDGKEILDTGGGILKMINHIDDDDYLVFNPDTVWNESYVDDIFNMQNFYFSNKLKNILLVTNKRLSFDKSLKGDFNLIDSKLNKEDNNNFIYIGCQILNKNLFEKYRVTRFPISKIWNELLEKKQLVGYESLNKFYHLTNLETFKKLKDF